MKERIRHSFLKHFDPEQDLIGVALLLAMFLAVNCISMTSVLHNSQPGHENFWSAVAGMLLLAGFIPLFLLPRFNFGFLVGVSFYGTIAGFVWITYFTQSSYDHALARWSAAASLLLFLLPLLFQDTRLLRSFTLSPGAMNRLVVLLLCFAAAALAWNCYYGVALVGIQEAEQLRSTFVRPAVLNYLTGSVVGAVLPFAFAYFAWQRRYVLAAVAILLIVSFYPALLNKTVLLAVVWLPLLFFLFRVFEPRRATVLALLIPMAMGLMLYALLPPDSLPGHLAKYLYGYTNVRMFAFPSIAMDRYSDFFASHELTHFCQVGIVRAIKGCQYAYQLGVEMEAHYHLGNLNASLFATEGTASVGPIWAPLSALLCGLIVSVGNSVSARLPPPLIAASAGLVLQALLNVPLSAGLLSNGLFVLLLLWSVTPRPLPNAAISGRAPADQAAPSLTGG
ncbi:hypothetical protein SAMN05443247_04677 [Bradyrhizobium erythrophlei]|nr:hypothetical protein SAMN05443247_04677 [Bradyrhizobium erythrophlei]